MTGNILISSKKSRYFGQFIALYNLLKNMLKGEAPKSIFLDHSREFQREMITANEEYIKHQNRVYTHWHFSVRVYKQVGEKVRNTCTNLVE
jgi:hypothetical protein